MEFKEKYINPFTDFGFKKLFGTAYNKDLLIDFLSQVLGDREKIADLTYLNTENQGHTSSDRKAVFDLYCENEKGERFIIEVQNVHQQYFKDRSLYYSTFPVQVQAEKGNDWDYCLKAVYTIGILNFSFPDRAERERYLREVQLLDKDTYEVFYEKLTFIYLEMPKFKKKEEELETHFEKWMYILKNLPQLQSRPLKLQERIYEKLFTEAEVANLTPKDMDKYQESLKAYRDNYSILETAKREGRLEGRQEGEIKGRQENKIEVATRMKQKGLALETIAEVTGLSVEEIGKL